MAHVEKENITVNRLFGAVMEDGPDEGKQVMISPMHTDNVEFLTEDQKAQLVQSGSISIDTILVEVTDEAEEAKPATRSTRRGRGAAAEE